MYGRRIQEEGRKGVSRKGGYPTLHRKPGCLPASLGNLTTASCRKPPTPGNPIDFLPLWIGPPGVTLKWRGWQSVIEHKHIPSKNSGPYVRKAFMMSCVKGVKYCGATGCYRFLQENVTKEHLSAYIVAWCGGICLFQYDPISLSNNQGLCIVYARRVFFYTLGNQCNITQ